MPDRSSTTLTLRVNVGYPYPLCEMAGGPFGKLVANQLALAAQGMSMYVITGKEYATELSDVPPPSPVEDPAVFLPGILVPDLRLFYPTFDEDSTAIIQFQHAKAHYVGPPNDESFAGHPLHSIASSAHPSEIGNSGFVATLERMNRAHPRHDPAMFSTFHHFFFPFKECVVEIIAKSYTFRIDPRLMSDIVAGFDQ